MRCLAIGNMYPPQHLGGYELVWQSAIRNLRALGHDARVLASDFRLAGAKGTDDADVHRELRWWWRDHAFPRFSVRERLALERHNARVLDRHLRELEPDVVTWWSMGGMSLSLIERVRRRGLPAVAFVHDDWLVYGPKVDAWLRLPWARRVRFSDAARYVFVSETTRRHAIAACGELASTGIAHSGIDPSYLDPHAAREWSWRLLYVGRIDARKGVATAVASLAQLPDAATLTVVGEGDPAAERELVTQADSLGIRDRVTLAGARSRAELRGVYADADVVVFPVLWDEPWGLVPLEAMALGRPVVATGRGGSAEYLRDGENALLFEAGDPAALATAVTRLADDAELRSRLRAGGAATAANHTEHAFNAQVVAEIERVVGAR